MQSGLTCLARCDHDEPSLTLVEVTAVTKRMQSVSMDNAVDQTPRKKFLQNNYLDLPSTSLDLETTT